MAREKLKNFFRDRGVIAPTGRLNYSHNNEEGDKIGTSTDPVHNDLRKGLMDTILPEYIQYITQPENDFYQTSNPIKINNYQRGDTLNTSENSTRSNIGDNNIYAGQDDQQALERSNSEYLIRKDSYIDKTGGISQGSGHNLLKGNKTTNKAIPETQLENAILDSNLMLLRNNRFSDAVGPDTLTVTDGSSPLFNTINPNLTKQGYQFKESGTSIDEFESDMDGDADNQGTLQSNYIFGNYKSGRVVLKINQLKKLGQSLLLKASGFSLDGKTSQDSDQLINDMNNDPNFKSTNISDNISEPGHKSISGNTYRSKYADGFPKFKTLTGETLVGGNTSPTQEIKSTREGKGEFFNQNSESFGQTYNSNFHFNGTNSNIHKAQLAIAISAVKLLMSDVFGEIINYFSDIQAKNKDFKADLLISNPKEEEYDNSTHGTFLLGKSRACKNLTFEFIKEKYLVKTLHNYKDCVDRGLGVCFHSNVGNNAEQSPGFWLAVATSVLKRFKKQSKVLLDIGSFSSRGVEFYKALMDNLSNDPILSFMNAMATIGDISFKAFNGSHAKELSRNIKLPRNVDLMPDTPGNRVGKSRKAQGNTVNKLSMAQNDVPSAYLLPMNVIRAASKLDKGPNSINPLRAMMGSELVDNTYMSLSAEGSGNRIPASVVKSLEDRLDAEYVPLYLQDLRTNEIISFHAFLTNCSDTFNTTYDSTGGYGRMDSVHIFNKTSRSVQVDFKMIATSKEDFNSMWYKINKLMTVIYPQWTRGTRVAPAGESKDIFYQPFSQVIGATPVVRLRVGDIIKSNYSKFNLARIFGIGDKGIRVGSTLTPSSITNKLPQSITIGEGDTAKTYDTDAIREGAIQLLVGIFGSPVQWVGKGPSEKKGVAATVQNFVNNHSSKIQSVLTEYLINGFVNPLTSFATMYQLQDPALRGAPQPAGITNTLGNLVNEGSFGYVPLTTITMLKTNNNKGYVFSDNSRRIYTRRPIKIRIMERIEEKVPIHSKLYNQKINSGPTKRTLYKAQIIDGALVTEDDMFMKEIIVSHSDILPIPGAVFFNTFIASILFGASSFPASTLGSIQDLVGDFANQIGVGEVVGDMVDTLAASQETLFMDSDSGKNPYVKAYESNMGRGLAGVIQGLSFNWLDKEINWETDFNSRAPMGCSISLKLDVIHDIPPGLDHAGYNRAPIYNVGDIMRDISGDVYDDFGELAEFKYRQSTIPTKTNTRD